MDDIEKDRISDYMAAFYSISFFLKSQGVIQEIYYGEHKYLLCHIEQYEELFTDIFCGKYLSLIHISQAERVCSLSNSEEILESSVNLI